MRTQSPLLAALVLSATALHAQRDYEPNLTGYVTQITSPAAMDVNGTHIRIDGNTQFFIKTKKLARVAAADVAPFVGEAVQVYGKSHNKEHAISATQINLVQRKPSNVEGSGIVDAVLGSSTAGESTLRADGYVVRVPANCETTFTPPLNAATAFQTNVWITFRGPQMPDGSVMASKLTFSQNVVGESEERRREKTEHDPAAVDPGTKQSVASQYFAGIDPKRIPPFKDDAMQARINAMGDRLIPKYQHELPDTDPTKINFRFQLVDEPNWVGAFAWTNGIILIPHTTVERLQNDSQIAAVLAFGIAAVLEKQSQRLLPMNHKLLPLEVAGLAMQPLGGGWGAGISAASFAMLPLGSDTIRHAMEKSGRVSLDLMQDSGYDIYEAPRAWWVLADIKSKGIDRTPMPYSSEYLYKFLGETWHAH